jgi:hypothetical protein
MADNANAFSCFAQILQRIHRYVKGFRIKGTKAFVNKQALYLHLIACQVAQAKRKGKTSAADGYVIMDGETFASLLAGGGYL